MTALVLAALLGLPTNVRTAAAATETTERVSISTAGVGGNGRSEGSSVSGDGRFVVFASDSTNLVAGDTNARWDVFLRDRATGVTTLVSTAAGGGPANSGSFTPVISRDGRFVAFQSFATNLGPANPGVADIYVRELATGGTVIASAALSGASNGGSSGPSISGDGRFVAFLSTARNLVPGDSGFGHEIYLRDLSSGTTSVIPGTRGANAPPAISADGRYVSFTASGFALTGRALDEVFRYDTTSGSVDRVSIAQDGGLSNAGGSWTTAISDDGRFVAFTSAASNLVAGDTNGRTDAFVRDMVAGLTERVSIGTTGVQGNSGVLVGIAISGDGGIVAFTSGASNLVPSDTNGTWDVFLRYRARGTTVRASVTSSGGQSSGGRFGPGSDVEAISGNGAVVVFSSNGDNFVPGDTNGQRDVYARIFPPPNSPPTLDPIADVDLWPDQQFAAVGRFSDPDPADRWSATVSYGDGSAEMNLPLATDKTFNLAHTYTRAGAYVIRITITDAAGASGSTVAGVTVRKRPLVFVPGFGGSELVATTSGAVDIRQSDGRLRHQEYTRGELFWASLPHLVNVLDPEYFDILRFESGHPILTNIAATGDILTLPGNLGGYEELAPFFEANGYARGRDLFVQGWDFRFDARDRREALDTFISTVRARTGAPTIDLVAHSQGTQLVRAYLDTSVFRFGLAHVVLAGGPNLGTPRGSYAMLAGFCLATVGPACILPPHVVRFLLSSMPGGVATGVSPSYFDLADGVDLPVPYRVIPLQGDTEPAPDYALLRDALIAAGVDPVALALAESYHATDRTWLANSVSHTNAQLALVVGTGECTIGQVRQQVRASLDRYGRPTGFQTAYYYTETDGDGTVTRQSAALGNGVSAAFASGEHASVRVYFEPLNHGQLTQAAGLPTILGILRDDAVDARGPMPDRRSCAMFSTHSPVEFVLADALGRRLGSSDGIATLREVPDGLYDRFREMKVATLPTGSGSYTATLVGTGDGDATVSIRMVAAGRPTELRFAHVPISMATRATLTFDPTAGTASSLSVDLDGDGVIDLVRSADRLDTAAATDLVRPTITIDGPKAGAAVVGSVPLAWTASDSGSGVARSFALVDAGSDHAQTLAAPGPLALAPGKHAIAVYAEDRAGNLGSAARGVTAHAYEWLSPAADDNNAGRTVPVRFAVRTSTGAFVDDPSAVIELLDPAGVVVVGPLLRDRNPAHGIAITGDAYHADLTTKGVTPGSYTLRVRFDSASLVGSFVRPVNLR